MNGMDCKNVAEEAVKIYVPRKCPSRATENISNKEDVKIYCGKKKDSETG